jgi:predicted AAA+ superfamily ATPase
MMVSGFSISLLEKYSTRALSKKSSSPKLLPLCPALIHAYSDPDRLDSDPDWFGRVFETAIGAHLSKAFDRNLFYWREGKDEVDFVVAFNQKVIAIEVKSGRKKSSSGLRAFQERFHGSVGVVFDLELGERFLQSTNPRQFVLNCL